jgi:hydroxymethylglutaryl-CoA reductase
MVAAVSQMAIIVRQCARFTMRSDQPIMRAQVQVSGLADIASAKLRLLKMESEFISLANLKDAVLVSLGGGCKGFKFTCSSLLQ